MSMTATAAVRPELGGRDRYEEVPGGGVVRGGQPRLRLVPGPAQVRSRAGLVVGCLVLLGAGLVALLLLNISLDHGAYQLYRLESTHDALVEEQQALREQLAAQAAPQSLAKRAAELGMVPGDTPGYVRLSGGDVAGAPRPAAPGGGPIVTQR